MRSLSIAPALIVSSLPLGLGASLNTVPTPVPTIWIAGDSTTAPGGGGNGTEGWGQYLQYSFGSHARVNNSAKAGRSARSFTREGRFDHIFDGLQSGDWVIIEFGINDGINGGVPINGSTSTTGDKGRASCPGSGNQTCILTFK